MKITTAVDPAGLAAVFSLAGDCPTWPPAWLAMICGMAIQVYDSPGVYVFSLDGIASGLTFEAFSNPGLGPDFYEPNGGGGGSAFASGVIGDYQGAGSLQITIPENTLASSGPVKILLESTQNPGEYGAGATIEPGAHGLEGAGGSGGYLSNDDFLWSQVNYLGGSGDPGGETHSGGGGGGAGRGGPGGDAILIVGGTAGDDGGSPGENGSALASTDPGGNGGGAAIVTLNYELASTASTPDGTANRMSLDLGLSI